MSNSISKAQTYIKDMIDSIYKYGSLTADLEGADGLVRGFNDAGTVQVLDIALTGLGTYDRSTGYPAGDVTTTWRSYTLANDRGKKFNVDAMDDAESASLVFGNVAGEFMKQWVIPEVDATRFAKIAANAGTTPSGADLTSSTALTAIDTAMQTLDDAEVPKEDRILYVSSSVFYNIKQSTAFARNIQVETAPNGMAVNREIVSLDGVEVRMVPQGRFYNQVTLSATSGYTKTASTGRNLNFLLLSKSAATAITRHAQPRIFDPMTNQAANAWAFDYRIYHDLIVPNAQKKKIYAHIATA